MSKGGRGQTPMRVLGARALVRLNLVLSCQLDPCSRALLRWDGSSPTAIGTAEHTTTFRSWSAKRCLDNDVVAVVASPFLSRGCGVVLRNSACSEYEVGTARSQRMAGPITRCRRGVRQAAESLPARAGITQETDLAPIVCACPRGMAASAAMMEGGNAPTTDGRAAGAFIRSWRCVEPL